MRFGKRLHTVSVFALACLACASAASADKTFTFSYDFPTGGGSVSAAGTLITDNANTITSITGTRTYEGVTANIIGLSALNGFGGNDNLLFGTTPYLTFNGFTYTIDTLAGNRGSQVNVFYDPAQSLYSEDDMFTYYGDFTLTTVPPIVPEPGSATLLVGIAMTGAGFLAQRRRKQTCR